MERDKRYARLAEMSKELFEMRFDDEGNIENYWLDIFFQEYLKVSLPNVLNWFDFVWENQKTKKASYGDIDWSLTKVFDGEYITPKEVIDNPVEKGKRMNIGGQKHQIKAIYYEDHVSCAEHTKFIIVKQTQTILDKEELEFHVRIIYDKTDYKKNNQYVHRPNLKWYKDRGFYLHYIKKLENTPLSQCYGDCRDRGYVFTAKKAWFRDEYTVEQGAMGRYDKYLMAVRALSGAQYSIEEDKANN